MSDDELGEIERQLKGGYFSGASHATISNLLAENAELKGTIEAMRMDHRTKLDTIFGMVRDIKLRLENHLYGGRSTH